MSRSPRRQTPADNSANSATVTPLERARAEAADRATAVRLLSKREVLDRIPLSYPSIWALMRAGKFPRSRKAGNRVVWIEAEINDWILGRPVQRLKGDPQAAD